MRENTGLVNTDIKYPNHNAGQKLSFLQIIEDLPVRKTRLANSLLAVAQKEPTNDQLLELIEAERSFLQARAVADRYNKIIKEGELKVFNKDLQKIEFKTNDGTFEIKKGFVIVKNPLSLSADQKKAINTKLDELLGQLSFWETYDYGLESLTANDLPDTGLSGFKLVGALHKGGGRCLSKFTADEIERLLAALLDTPANKSQLGDALVAKLHMLRIKEFNVKTLRFTVDEINSMKELLNKASLNELGKKVAAFKPNRLKDRQFFHGVADHM